MNRNQSITIDKLKCILNGMKTGLSACNKLMGEFERMQVAKSLPCGELIRRQCKNDGRVRVGKVKSPDAVHQQGLPSQEEELFWDA